MSEKLKNEGSTPQNGNGAPVKSASKSFFRRRPAPKKKPVIDENVVQSLPNKGIPGGTQIPKPAAAKAALPKIGTPKANPPKQNSPKIGAIAPSPNKNQNKPFTPRPSAPKSANAFQAMREHPLEALTHDFAKPNAAQNAKNGAKMKLKVIPLGGIGEIGKNMTAFEYGNDIVVVDCGMTFPDDELLGVDLVIPDITYLRQNADKVRAILITHAHEDHIGALPYVLRELHMPIYCTPLAAGMIKLRTSEHKQLKNVKIIEKKAGDKFKVGAFDIEFIHVNHSIPDAVSIVVKSPVGTAIVTGDFKIDTTPVDGKMTDLARFGQLGNEGVLLLLMDSTNAERPGYAMSEKKVGNALEQQFKGCESRIIVATFASNVHRLQQVINAAVKHGRKVAVSGRSMENIIKVTTELGYVKIPEHTLVELQAMKRVAPNKLCVLTTGSQGEPMSALYRMALGTHKQLAVGPGDKIILSASPIPGNEKSVTKIINELMRRGAEVVYDKALGLHVSGHASQEELKMILGLVKPKFFMPVHGEYKHLRINSDNAKETGMNPNSIFISEIGKVLELTADTAKFNGTVPCGRVFVDGLGVGDVGNAVLRDRKHLSQDGLIVAVVSIDSSSGTVIAGPDIVSRGFVYMRESEDLTEGMRRAAQNALEECENNGIRDWASIKTTMKDCIAGYIFKKTKRSPMIMPVIMDI